MRIIYILIPLFKTLVRPILEYGNTVWYNKIKKNTTLIEQVQRKFTKHVQGIENLNYEERLRKIKLPSLEYRQFRGDLIQVFKITHGYYDKSSTKSLFSYSNDRRMRGHNYKIIKQSINKSQYSNFFTNRVVNPWNKLPFGIVNAKSINEFKNKVDKHFAHILYQTNIY